MGFRVKFARNLKPAKKSSNQKASSSRILYSETELKPYAVFENNTFLCNTGLNRKAEAKKNRKLNSVIYLPFLAVKEIQNWSQK